MKGGLKFLTWTIGIIVLVAAWFGMEGITTALPPELRRIIAGIVFGVAVVWGLKEIIIEGVAEGVEKGITALLAKSDIVRSEISAAIADANGLREE